MSFLMLEVAILGRILGINPFNQPAVEKVKILTKKLLNKMGKIRILPAHIIDL